MLTEDVGLELMVSLNTILGGFYMGRQIVIKDTDLDYDKNNNFRSLLDPNDNEVLIYMCFRCLHGLSIQCRCNLVLPPSLTVFILILIKSFFQHFN